MIKRCIEYDFASIYAIINDAAEVYRGIIPPDRWHHPYMSQHELRRQMEDGVIFYGWYADLELRGVMGIQDKGKVTLIRHAYVQTSHRQKGIGGQLLSFLTDLTTKPILIGTWAAAAWAIAFYQKNGFQLVTETEKNRLLRTYWNIPERQVETSVVLSNRPSTNTGFY